MTHYSAPSEQPLDGNDRDDPCAFTIDSFLWHCNSRKPASAKDLRASGTFPEFLANKKEEDYICLRAPYERRLNRSIKKAAEKTQVPSTG